MDSPLQPRRVVSRLTFEVTAASRMAVAVHVANGVETTGEHFVVQSDGEVVGSSMIVLEYGSRVALLEAPPGRLEVAYEATVVGDGPVPVDASTSPSFKPQSFGPDQIVALRQSRYCPSDRIDGFAASTFDKSRPPRELAHDVSSWVFNRVEYTPGSSGPADSAVHTLLSGKGVCRDYAHLTIALLRAVGVPARLVSVYAPGLSPMDFHAVTEFWNGESWEITDSTRLAPRQSLVRIATGRDAADTAFVTVMTGEAEFTAYEVYATIDGDLPLDKHDLAVTLP